MSKLYNKKINKNCATVPSTLFFPSFNRLYPINYFVYFNLLEEDLIKFEFENYKEFDFVILQLIYSVICVNNLNNEEIDFDRQYTIYINDAVSVLATKNYTKSQRDHFLACMLNYHSTFVKVADDGEYAVQQPLIVIENIVKNKISDDGYITFRSKPLSFLLSKAKQMGAVRFAELSHKYKNKYKNKSADVSHFNCISARIPWNDATIFVIEICRILLQSGGDGNAKVSTLVEANTMLKMHFCNNITNNKQDDNRVVFFRAINKLKNYCSKYIETTESKEIILNFYQRNIYANNPQTEKNIKPTMKNAESCLCKFSLVERARNES